MKKKMKAVCCCSLVLSMCLGTVASAEMVSTSDKDVAKRAVSFYHGEDSEFVKISHPEKAASTKTENVTDGLLDYLGNGRVGVPGVDEGANGQGDRGQGYSWAAVAYGDWMYVSTLYNPTMSTIQLMDNGLGHDYDPELLESLMNTFYRGEFFVSEEDDKNPGSVLSKINVKTGEIKILMSKEKTKTNVNFRNAIQFNEKLYFCGAVNGVPSIYEIDPNNNDEIKCVFIDESMKSPDAWSQALKKRLSPAIRGMSVYKDYVVISCVGLDENPYIAISKDPSKGFEKIAFTWKDVKNKIPGELLGYPACHLTDSIYGGSIWEMITFNDKLYIAICTGTPDNSPDGGKTMQSFALMRGECNGDPTLRESWTWSPVIGDKNDGAKYTFGIDPERTRSGACNMMVFKDHLYIGEYNDTEIALINILFDKDASFMADNLEQSVNLYRMDKNENIEMVMGDSTEMFPNGGISGMGSGFDKCENQYIWRMDTFQDKLYVGTFDESSILYPVGQISNGDIFNLTPEQWERQMEYLKELIKELMDKMKEEAAEQEALKENKTEENIGIEEEAIVDPEEISEENESEIEEMPDAKVLEVTEQPLEENAELAVLEELYAASESVSEGVSIFDLPQTMDGEGGYDLHSLGELHQAMIMISGMLEQDESWTDDQKLEAKVRFAEFYETLYQYYNDEETKNQLPDFVKEVYEKILNNQYLEKVIGMSRCIGYLRENVRGFDMMSSKDGVNFEIITRDGLGDNHNQGLRTFAISNNEKNPWMCIGTANPFYGTQIWRLQDESLVFAEEKPVEPEEKPNPEEKPESDLKPESKPEVSDEKKDTPETGDASNAGMLSMLALASGAVIILMKKRRY